MRKYKFQGYGVQKRSSQLPQKEWDRWRDRFFEAYNSCETGTSIAARLKHAANLLKDGFEAEHGFNPMYEMMTTPLVNI
jgi:hypothetical protein